MTCPASACFSLCVNLLQVTLCGYLLSSGMVRYQSGTRNHQSIPCRVRPRTVKRSTQPSRARTEAWAGTLEKRTTSRHTTWFSTTTRNVYGVRGQGATMHAQGLIPPPVAATIINMYHTTGTGFSSPRMYDFASPKTTPRCCAG